jgi:hypothetical protein
MAESWLVHPDLLRLSLSDGQFLDIKRELTFGEHRKMLAGQMKLVDGEYVRDLEKIGVTLILAYVVAWSLVDRDGRPLPCDEATLVSLQPHRVEEIRRALDAHLEREEALRAEREANPTSAAPLRAIS